MEGGGTIEVWVNPLELVAWWPHGAEERREPTTEMILLSLCAPDVGGGTDGLAERAEEITGDWDRLPAVPTDGKILNKLVWPLRQAKVAYVLGSYMGTIALCGVTCEMVATLMFELGKPRLNDGAMDEETEKKLLGYTFEKLGQDRRLKVLDALGMVDNDLKQAFETVRTHRRRYLHLLSEGDTKLPEDAVKCYQAAAAVVRSILGSSISDGKLLLNPRVMEYVRGEVGKAVAMEGAETLSRGTSQRGSRGPR